jgi:spermidine synthase
MENDSPVAVVRRNQVLYLLYDTTIIGAEFDDPYLRLQAAYPGFAIMQCVLYLDRQVDRAIQVGLGIGTVPSFLRASGIPTDVVEISDAVVRQATNYFQYEKCEPSDPEECTRGTTYITDGLAFIDDAPAEPVYDSFIIDVYTGSNPVAFFVKEVIDTVHTKWLKPRGVLVMNFVGFMNGDHAAVPRSVLKTLRASFAHVKCFRCAPPYAREGAILT